LLSTRRHEDGPKLGTMRSGTYTIRGGTAGRERLRVLSAVMGPTTAALLDRVGIPRDATCIDVGCGGGEVAAMLAARAIDGHVVGTDADEVKVALARAEAAANVELVVEDAATTVERGPFADVVYARFLLSHLGDGPRWVGALASLLAPGGVLVLEDTHIAGAWCAPPSAAFERALDIYSRTVRANGGDPDIGPQLPPHLVGAGLVDVDVQVAQPAALVGDRKRIQRLTLDALRDAAVAAGQTDHAEIDALLAELDVVIGRPDSVVTTAHVVQTWGRRPR
jgi:SAM-dependent methyltransferase